VWALGVILYETLAGVLPYQSSAPSALFVKIVTEPPVPLRTVLPEAPAELAALIEKCLAARPEDRFASAADLARELRVFMGEVRPEPDGSDAATRVQSAHPRPLEPPQAPMLVPELDVPLPRAKPMAAPDLEIPASQMKLDMPAARPVTVSVPTSVEDYGDMSSELIPMSDRRLSLAEDPRVMQPSVPSRVARASLGMRGQVTERQGEQSVRSLVGLGMMWLIVLVITASLSAFVPGEWPVVLWATSLDGAPIVVVATLAGLLVALGLWASVGGARAQPVSWGLLLAGPGLLCDGIIVAGFVFHGMPSLTGSGGLDALARVVFPWPTSLVLVGLSMLFLRQAWWSWSSGDSGRTVRVVIKVVIAAIALFGAVQVIRGGETLAQGTSIAS
jgi:hypothetical protein